MSKKPTKRVRQDHGMKLRLTSDGTEKLEAYAKAKVVSLKAIMEQSRQPEIITTS